MANQYANMVREQEAVKKAADLKTQLESKQRFAEGEAKTSYQKATQATNPLDQSYYHNQGKAIADSVKVKSTALDQEKFKSEQSYKANVAKIAAEKDSVQKQTTIKSQNAEKAKFAKETTAKATADKTAAMKTEAAAKAKIAADKVAADHAKASSQKVAAEKASAAKAHH